MSSGLQQLRERTVTLDDQVGLPRPLTRIKMSTSSTLYRENSFTHQPKEVYELQTLTSLKVHLSRFQS